MNKPTPMAGYRRDERSFATAMPDLYRLAQAMLRRLHAVATRTVEREGARS